VSAYLSSLLELHSSSNARAALYREGMLAMERITQGARRSTYLMIPNAHAPVRDCLAYSGSINEDNDHYFNDPLYPRIDEGVEDDMNADSADGIKAMDDDGDGALDEQAGTPYADDDEDGQIGEDPLDGVDNDGDGNIDEDLDKDATDDHAAGIKGVDDDGDGQVDEGTIYDNDEDGTEKEDLLNPVIYQFDNAAHTLTESLPYTDASATLSDRVTLFQVTREAPQRILIELTLTGENGERIAFYEHVYLQNTLQRTGKRVR
jgi:hypothetical protein